MLFQKEYLIDDLKIVIPEEIKRMTKEEKRREIARLEAEAAAEKTYIRNNLKNKKVLSNSDKIR